MGKNLNTYDKLQINFKKTRKIIFKITITQSISKTPL